MPPPNGTATGAFGTCLAEASAGKPRSVYVLDGDPFLTLRAARELANALVPEGERALNVVELDPGAGPSEVASELATGGLFGGRKVVLLVEPAFLASKEDAEGAFRRALDQWKKGAQRDGARRLLALSAKAGWSLRELAPSGGEEPDYDELSADLGFALDPAGRKFVAAVARFAIERDMKVAKNDTGALELMVEGGFPEGRILIVAAGKVDGKLAILKRLSAVGRRMTLGIENAAKPWEPARLVLGPLLDTLLAGKKKSVDAAGQARLAELVGDDARTLDSEVAKLAAYVGDREVITAADVDEVVTRVAEDPFFAVSNAVEARDLAQALVLLDRSLSSGVTTFQLVGVIAAAIRRMLAERERARKVAGEVPLRTLRDWEKTVLPTISSAEMGDRKPYGFFMKYQASLRFERGELLRGLAAVSAADIAVKSGLDGRLALERALFGLLTHPEKRSRS